MIDTLMTPFASPSPPAPAADSLAGGGGDDFDTLDFSFLDKEQSALSSEDPLGATEAPAPQQESKTPLGETFDPNAWSEAAPEDKAGPEFGLGDDLGVKDGLGPSTASPDETEENQGSDDAETSLAPEDSPAPISRAVPRKYLFDRSFDYVPPPPAPPPEPEPEPSETDTALAEAESYPPPQVEEPPPPTFSEEELAAARAAAYADGETAGLQAAMSSIESRTSRTLEMIAQQIPDLLADRQDVVNAVAKEAARLAYALTAHMMPELARTYGLGEIEAVIHSSLSIAIDRPRLSIRIPPHLAPPLQEKLRTLLPGTGFHGHIDLFEDATLGASDVRLEWGDGGAERLVQRAWGELTEIAHRLIGDLKERTEGEGSEPLGQKTENDTILP